MPAANLVLPEIEKGATYRHRIIWQASNSAPISLVGCTARMSIKSTVDAVESLVDLTTTNGRLVLGGATGTIDLIINDATTQNLVGSGGLYDLEIVKANNDVVRLVKGTVSFSAEVTKILSSQV